MWWQGDKGRVMERQFQSIFGFHFFSQGIPRITLGLLSQSIISLMGSEWSSRVRTVLAFQWMVPFWFLVPSTLSAMMGSGRQMRVKLSRERRCMSMKFPVAPESMRVVVSTVLFIACSKMGKLMFLLLGDTTSTQFIEWEEDVEVTSLLKNTKLLGWRFQRFLL